MERAGHTERAGPIAVMYTPALQPAWEARDVAVAAHGFAAESQDHVHVGSTKNGR
jgi:hypothetical protein